MAILINGNPPATHANSALAHNKMNAGLFNQYETYMDGFDNTITSIISFVQSLDSQIQFIDDPTDVLNETIGTPLIVSMGVCLGTGEVEPFTLVTEVTVSILSDTTGGAQINGGVIPVVVPLVNGIGTVSVTAIGPAGAVELELTDSGGSGLDVSDVLTINWS